MNGKRKHWNFFYIHITILGDIKMIRFSFFFLFILLTLIFHERSHSLSISYIDANTGTPFCFWFYLFIDIGLACDQPESLRPGKRQKNKHSSRFVINELVIFCVNAFRMQYSCEMFNGIPLIWYTQTHSTSKYLLDENFDAIIKPMVNVFP